MRVRCPRAIATVAFVPLSLSCSKPDARPTRDSARDSSVVATHGSQPGSTWAPELGQLLIVPSDSDNAAIVLFPDGPSADGIASAVTLLSPAGDTSSGRVTLGAADTLQCGDAPIARLAGGSSAWSVGVRAASLTPIHMDSIGAMSSADSLRFAVDMTRLASTVAPEKESRFRGLPFVIAGARRFSVRGTDVAVAHLVRRLNQEATPLEEHTLILAERSPGGAYKSVYQLRSEGTEDSADHYEALAALAAPNATFLLIARDRAAGTEYDFLERTAPGVWRVRWSRVLSC